MGLNLPRIFVVFVNCMAHQSNLERKGYVGSARCECGAERHQNINHIVFSCPEYEQRRILYDEFNRTEISQPEYIWSWLRREELSTLIGFDREDNMIYKRDKK